MSELTTIVDQDNNAVSPYSEDEWTLSKVALFHKRMDLPNHSGLNSDNFDSWDALRDALEDQGAIRILPVWMYNHSGVNLRAGEDNPFHDRWDSGQVGFVYSTGELLAEWGLADESVFFMENHEVEQYSNFLNGDVFRFRVEDINGNVLDSCGGYYDESEALLDAYSSAERLNRKSSWDINALAASDGGAPF
jgi:hypothetical protein